MVLLSVWQLLQQFGDLTFKTAVVDDPSRGAHRFRLPRQRATL